MFRTGDNGHGTPGSLGSELDKYTDPFDLPSRARIPKSMSEVLLFCRWLYTSNPQFRQTVKRMVAHGVTRLKFRGDVGSPSERDRLARDFKEKILGMQELRLLGEDYIAYGTALMRIYYPFTRQLIDRRGGFRTYTLSQFPENRTSFNLRTLTYRVPDPRRTDLPVSSRPLVDLPFRDLKRKTVDGIRLARLDPRFVKFRFSSWARSRQVQYRPEPKFAARIKDGNLYEINRTPEDLIRTVRDGSEYLFRPGEVFVMANETISGFLEDGFGLPETITAFPNLYKMAIYDRLDESFSNEMLSPYRVVSPADVKEGSIHLAEFRTAVDRMLREQRLDRSRVSSFPIPINYQELGGNGKALTPKDLKEYEQGQLKEAIGVPAELHSPTLALDRIPYATRLFESTHADLFEGLGRCANWAIRCVSAYLYEEEYDAVLEPSSVADDAQRKALLRELYASQEIPRRVYYDDLQLDNPLELKKERAEEDVSMQEKLTEVEQEAQRRMEAGAMDDLLAQEGQQAAPATTPVNVRNEAETLAAQWLGMPEGQRHQAMQMAYAQNPVLYASAKDIMERLLRQGESQGRQQVYQQAQQGGA